MRHGLVLPLITSVLSAPLSGEEGAASSAVAAEYFERPAMLRDAMQDGPLKQQLLACAETNFTRSDFSIAHRGAPLRYPEHTRESYVAAAQMGAGYVECDVTFTRDLELVCRHSQCDLHTTTNILETRLAGKCSGPFSAARIDENGAMTEPASARCCTSDLTLQEFLSLEGRMDTFNPAAKSAQEYIEPPGARGRLMTHAQSIELFRELGVKMIPELKSPMVEMPFNGFTQQDYAQKIIDEYKRAGVPASDVRLQSFNLDDIIYWLEHEPEFGNRALFLDGRYEQAGFDHRDPANWNPGMQQLAGMGVRIIAPPLWMLVEAQNGAIVPSLYAKSARDAGLDIITWSLERSGSLRQGGGWYYQTLNGLNPNPAKASPGVIKREGDAYELLHVLAQDVGVLGVFSDWPATVTYYANCMGLE